MMWKGMVRWGLRGSGILFKEGPWWKRNETRIGMERHYGWMSQARENLHQWERKDSIKKKNYPFDVGFFGQRNKEDSKDTSLKKEIHENDTELESESTKEYETMEEQETLLQEARMDSMEEDDVPTTTSSFIHSSTHDNPQESSSSSSSKELARPAIPDYFPELLCLPVTGRPLFPRFMKPVQIKDEEVCKAIINLKKRGQPYLGAFLTKEDGNEKDRISDLSEIYRVGVFAQIQNVIPTEGIATILLLPHRRIRATALVKSDPVSVVKVENLKDEPFNKDNPVIKALSQEIIATIKDIAKLSPFLREQINLLNFVSQVTNVFDDPAQLADFCAGLVTSNSGELQEILESLVIEERLRKTLILLKKELVNARLQHDIGREVEEKINKRQREYYLMEQLKNIKKELGLEKDDKESLVTRFKEKAAQLKMPEHAKKVFDEEINKLAHLEQASAEFNVTRNYLDWLTTIPWGVYSKENFDIKGARAILDRDHYGLKEVKERILEFIAVGKLRGSVQGKIICLVGPPGVGKTSVGKSIAAALSRQFFRFSVGGLTDVAEIKGHRRTYIGAMPGKIIQAFKKVETENPLVLIDEIDKIGRGYNGDPSSALLEMLDPEQNSSFLDHYLDVPVDLSRVLFVCTANSTDTIPQPLLDRMEVMHLAGYVSDEKIAIAERYLIPQATKNSGLPEHGIIIHHDALEEMIKYYCRESGVRGLQKHIEKIIRKVAFKIVNDLNEDGSSLESKVSTYDITAKNLHDYVGYPPFTSDRLYETTPPGVVMGLAWTQMGGSALYIETVVEETLSSESKPHLSTTGKLGEVMKESSSIAYTFAKGFLHRYEPRNDFFRHAGLHLHVPEGAISKDGPSAGCTMATSLLSLALNRSVRPDLAMTGELTLTGKILKIGGVKEKTLAAKRSNVSVLLFPESNRRDYEELPDFIKKDLIVHFVDHYDHIFPIVFPHLLSSSSPSKEGG